MRRDILELADGSLFFEKIKSRFNAADADLLSRVYAIAEKKAAESDQFALQAAELLIEQDTDVITAAGALLAPLVWQGRVGVPEISGCFDQELDAVLNDLISPLILRTATEHPRRRDIHTLLSSLDGQPRKAIIRNTSRLFQLEGAPAPDHAASGKCHRTGLFKPIEYGAFAGYGRESEWKSCRSEPSFSGR